MLLSSVCFYHSCYVQISNLRVELLLLSLFSSPKCITSYNMKDTSTVCRIYAVWLRARLLVGWSLFNSVIVLRWFCKFWFVKCLFLHRLDLVIINFGELQSACCKILAFLRMLGVRGWLILLARRVTLIVSSRRIWPMFQAYPRTISSF